MLVGADHETLVDYSTIKLIFKVMKKNPRSMRIPPHGVKKIFTSNEIYIIICHAILLLCRSFFTESHPKSEEHGSLLGSLTIKESNGCPHVI